MASDVFFWIASRPTLGHTQPPVQWVPGALSAEGRWWGMQLTIHFPLVLRTRNSCVMPPNPTYCYGMYWSSITFTSGLSKQICVWSRYARKCRWMRVRMNTGCSPSLCLSASSSVCVCFLPLPPYGFRSLSLYSWFIVRIHWMGVWVAGNRMEERPAYSHHLCSFFLCLNCILGGFVFSLFTSRDNEPCWF